MKLSVPRIAAAAALLAASLGAAWRAAAEDSPPALPEESWSLDEFDNLRQLPRVKPEDPARLVLGETRGFLHVYEEREEGFEEIWISEHLEGPVGGLFVADVDSEGLPELLVYTETGRLYVLDAADYRTLWSNPPTEYGSITAMILHNVDDDEQLEMVFCGDGMLIIYDGLDRFEEWRSDQSNIEAVEIVVADVDGDDADEIVLNDGFVFDARFRDLEWQSPESFGERLGILDLDNDGIVELIGEFSGGQLRIFDVDLRRQKAIRH